MRALGSWLYFLTALTKGEESKLASEAQLEEAAKKMAVSEAKGALGGTRLGDHLLASKADSLQEVEAALWEHLSGCIGEISSLRTIPEGLIEMLRAYSMKYDLFNLILVLRKALYGAEPTAGFLPLGIMSERGLLAELDEAGSLEGLCDLLKECGLERCSEVISKYAKLSPEELRAKRATIEGELWEGYYSGLLSIAEKLGDPNLEGAVKISITVSNIRALFRALPEGRGGLEAILVLRRLLPPGLMASVDSMNLEDLPKFFEGSDYGTMLKEALSERSKGGGLSAVEEVFDKWEARLLRDLLSQKLFLPSTIYWYLIQKELEIRRARRAFVEVFERAVGVY